MGQHGDSMVQTTALGPVRGTPNWITAARRTAWPSHPEIVESNFGKYRPHGFLCILYVTTYRMFDHELHNKKGFLFVGFFLHFCKIHFWITHGKKKKKKMPFCKELGVHHKTVLYAKLNINIYSVKILYMQTMHITHLCIEELVNTWLSSPFLDLLNYSRVKL